jgi:hypothetical protein
MNADSSRSLCTRCLRIPSPRLTALLLLLVAADAQAQNMNQLQISYIGNDWPATSAPNEYGPVASRAIDLDGGTVLPGNTSASDLFVMVNVRSLAIGGGSDAHNAIADAGPNSANLAQCQQILMSGSAKDGTSFSQAPTHYYCVRTTEGQIALFRVVSVFRTFRSPRVVDIFANLEYAILVPEVHPEVHHKVHKHTKPPG